MKSTNFKCFLSVFLFFVSTLISAGCAVTDTDQIEALKKENKQLRDKIESLKTKLRKENTISADEKYLAYSEWNAMLKLIKMRAAVGEFYKQHEQFPKDLTSENFKPFLKKKFDTDQIPKVAGSRAVTKYKFRKEPKKNSSGWAYTASGYVYINSSRETTGNVPLYKF